MFMLPMQIQKFSADFPKLCKRYGQIIYTIFRFFLGNLPADNQTSFFYFQIFLQLFQFSFFLFPQRKGKFDQRLLASVANHILVGFLSQGKLNGAEQYGLSGSCFTCQYIQTGSKFDNRLFNQCQIFYHQSIKHGFPFYTLLD